MQIFVYTAKDSWGKSIKGKVEARDQSTAVQTLRERDLYVVSLKPFNQQSTLPVFDTIFNAVKSEDIVTFTQQLATMINSGLPLTDGLSILQAQSKPGMSKIVGAMLRDIQGGSSFAKALESHGKVFSKIYISSVKAGEASGKLDEVLVKLAETEEKKREFASKTKGALIYPIIVIIVMFLVMVIMMVVVIPKLTDMFDDFGAELPLITKILITTSEWAQKLWWMIFAGIAGAFYALHRWYQTKNGREAIDLFLLRIPVYGVLRTQVSLADITRTLALLTASGISILEALEIVTLSAGNVVFEKALKNATSGVEKGLPLATMLAREQVFPPLLSQMVSVGEETGQLSPILVKVSQYYESESEHAIKNLTTAIEPLIMVVLGIGVGFLVLAIITPIYQLTSSF